MDRNKEKEIMDIVMLQFQDLGMGLVLGLSAAGSAAGAGVAGMAAVGAWKKKYSQNKPASFMLLAFVGAPLTQTIYGMIVMNRMYEICLTKRPVALGYRCLLRSCDWHVCILPGKMCCLRL